MKQQIDYDILSEINFDEFRKQVLDDYYLASLSREMSILGRKEVLTGKAKFGIFGDGKELAQIVAAKHFRNGDFRSGYYRDQTFMMAAGMTDPGEFFAQLYADTDLSNEPASGGRQMNAHFATTFVDDQGEWIDFTTTKNSTADISPTAGQFVRGLGVALASKLFRSQKSLNNFPKLSKNGNEVSFVTVGDASTSEGPFWETINAAGVLQVPLAVFVWDDGYGISVPKKYQTTKQSISKCLQGMAYDSEDGGILIYTIKGWDYEELNTKIEEGIRLTREYHIPVLFHVQEMTQPQGHSTSGSHERYKSEARLQWEKEWDCIAKLGDFILENHIADEEQLEQLRIHAKSQAKEAQVEAWEKYLVPIRAEVESLTFVCKDAIYLGGEQGQRVASELKKLQNLKDPYRREILRTAYRLYLALEPSPAREKIGKWYELYKSEYEKIYDSHLYSQSPYAVSKVDEIPVQLSDTLVNGFQLLNQFFEKKLYEDPRIIAFGEDVGKIGDVNQGFSGLQEKFGEGRVFDTGIRENSIIGQGIGMAMRGLRPIAEIQYLDYLLYGLQPLSDDVATLQYRTLGQQRCPLIVRTRGHRLEGIWHSGSPMGMVINALRGMHVCVPRDMTRAAGMYNTLLQSDEPALVVECLNGYRLKENLPSNLGEYTIPLGKVEVIREGEDITVVSYGSTLRIIEESITNYIAPRGISVEVIDVQTLLPFDLNHDIIKSLVKTNRILIVDEDVSSGASAFIFQQIMEQQEGYYELDVPIQTLTAKDHRPAYGSDGDYFSKPNAEDVAVKIFKMLEE